ncbi:alpha,alpha-trehalase TreF [Sphingomonas morindae]|uniref:Alpha,alpha-trehalase TreF n=1 Tax=Sphingomonas morindae TaxID=1541170 RepID=A0ABY4XBE6_9SPHN|nr:alpha,alpha-trehalase TreF [Sphingomonas morindae]USI74076.1 alpha,alpha-trehalase TreF [Sphingomonas morindae]
MIVRFAAAALFLGVAAEAAPAPAPAPPTMPVITATPADIYGPLYRAVELARLFPDSKTFADAVPRRDAGAILAAYREEQPRGPALRRFVLANFSLPATPAPPPPVAGARATPLAAHIAALWPVLTRQPLASPPGSSALPLPRSYVVPGGRFREIYYWDSYFTMLGLARDGRADLVDAMVENFTTLIERYGHIPNGTRSYYLSRSQPPVFYLMVGLARSGDAALARRRLAALRREHDYWMLGADALKPGQAARHVVRLADGRLLNRYWDARDTPRDESYAEDVATAAALPARARAGLWRELRAGAESGWDYSSRWLADGRSLASIRTTSIAPVDLNSLLYGMEAAIAAGCARLGDAACAADYRAQALRRGAAIRTLMWDARGGRFADLLWRSGRQTPTLSAATLYPLFTGVADPAQARAVARTVRARLIGMGGLRTTRAATGQQWDAPNGWAPLQWIAVQGLRRYGEAATARRIATRWLATVQAGYAASGTLVEKYDVERRGVAGHGGEYAVQQGFGWTNGVTRALMDAYPS